MPAVKKSKASGGDSPTSPETKKSTPKSVRIYYRIFNQHDAFLTMIRAAVQRDAKTGGTDYIVHIISDWWRTAFGLRPFPKGGRLDKLVLAIRYELLAQGYRKNGVEPAKKFKQNHAAAIDFNDEGFSEVSRMLARCDEYGEFAHININHSEEGAIMATKKNTAKKDTAKKSNKKLIDGMTVSAFVIAKLLERKYTDAQILEMVHKGGYPNYKRGQIGANRGDLNSGRRLPESGARENPIERLIEYEGKIIPASEKPKKSKKASVDEDRLADAGIDVTKKTAPKKTTEKAAAKKTAPKKTTEKAAAKKTAPKKTTAKKTAKK